ncbi:site-specific integrase [Mucilaginibacter aquaedulcis]|uniref:site-specific integrase n=1 Tax=Mucilaginibacter aquaedulcis TaxID=1187081 RepID=UPI00338F576E
MGLDDKQWVHTSRQKTDTDSKIPLLPAALTLIKKYINDLKCIHDGLILPVLSNQKMNSYLKEVADICGINKELTYHIAIHTFATTVTFSNGVSIESVSKMLRHKNIRTTQHYANILDKKVSEDMIELKRKLALYQNPNLMFLILFINTANGFILLWNEGEKSTSLYTAYVMGFSRLFKDLIDQARHAGYHTSLIMLFLDRSSIHRGALPLGV